MELGLGDASARSIQQADEEAAQPSAHRNLEAPVQLWNEALMKSLFPNGLVVETMVG
ncbi:hypothetical protein HaLaN_02931, partial [Haematococcus lacustris]